MEVHLFQLCHCLESCWWCQPTNKNIQSCNLLLLLTSWRCRFLNLCVLAQQRCVTKARGDSIPELPWLNTNDKNCCIQLFLPQLSSCCPSTLQQPMEPDSAWQFVNWCQQVTRMTTCHRDSSSANMTSLATALSDHKVSDTAPVLLNFADRWTNPLNDHGFESPKACVTFFETARVIPSSGGLHSASVFRGICSFQLSEVPFWATKSACLIRPISFVSTCSACTWVTTVGASCDAEVSGLFTPDCILTPGTTVVQFHVCAQMQPQCHF